MAGLTQPSLDAISRSVELEGTGRPFSTPFIYRFLEKYVPVLLRSLTNFHFRGLAKVPHHGAVIFSANHLSNLDPFIKVIAAQRPIHFLAKDGHFKRQPHRFVMISTGQIETFRETGAKDALARVDQSLRRSGDVPDKLRRRRPWENGVHVLEVVAVRHLLAVHPGLPLRGLNALYTL